MRDMRRRLAGWLKVHRFGILGEIRFGGIEASRRFVIARSLGPLAKAVSERDKHVVS